MMLTRRTLLSLASALLPAHAQTKSRGATYPSEMRDIRALCPDMPFLVPGVGAQQGSLGDAVRAGVDARGCGMLISASRGVTYASKGSDFAEAARREATRLRDEINREREAIAAGAGARGA